MSLRGTAIQHAVAEKLFTDMLFDIASVFFGNRGFNGFDIGSHLFLRIGLATAGYQKGENNPVGNFQSASP